MWQDGRIILLKQDSPTIDLLISHGFGKGTLSRNEPNFVRKKQAGLVSASKLDPFATPTRITILKPTSNDIEETRELIDQISLKDSTNPEEFQLGFEEALYLVAEVRAIQVRQANLTHDPSSLLQLLMDHQKGFNSRYFGANSFIFLSPKASTSTDLPSSHLVYKHYRQLGWVVKLGNKVGVDLLLYPPGGPLQKHAQYGVAIRVGTQEHQYDTPWTVAARVLDTVAKNLLVALVTEPLENSTSLDHSGWLLEEIVLSRWQSTSTTNTS